MDILNDIEIGDIITVGYRNITYVTFMLNEKILSINKSYRKIISLYGVYIFGQNTPYQTNDVILCNVEQNDIMIIRNNTYQFAFINHNGTNHHFLPFYMSDHDFFFIEKN